MNIKHLMVAVLSSAALLCGAPLADAGKKPNILFIVMDDVGVDQLRSFGYGGPDAPNMPVLDSIAASGVRFRNTWTMPSCSTTRATFFEGRYPFRTDVNNAILSTDLANSQVSPYEALTPQLLHKAGYKSALIGKMHLSGTSLAPQNNPFGNGAMKALGWDYFAGWLDGAPYPVDTTAGGIGTDGQFSCGFVPKTVATAGACRQSDGSCTQMNDAAGTPGFDCLSSGGIFEPNALCSSPANPNLNFDVQNAYYTGQLILNEENGTVTEYPISAPNARKYRSVLETDLAKDWIVKQRPQQSWMLSLGFSAAHAPLQQAPRALLPNDAIQADGFNCTDLGDQRILSNQALEAMDHEIGRLLVETGLAEPSDTGVKLKPDSNTYVIVIGDNGTYGPTVKPPFNPDRAKGTVYQGGVWAPLIIAGPGVASPGRKVEAMINSADLYALFTEIAGVDIQKNVPKSRIVDAKGMINYLKSSVSRPNRNTNFSMMGQNIQAPGTEIYPCVIDKLSICTQIFPQQQLCADEGGTWYGPGGTNTVYTTCCGVISGEGLSNIAILPDLQQTVRNDQYKLVALTGPDCTNGGETTTEEFYRIDQDEPLPKLDNAVSNLLKKPQLTIEERRNYLALKEELKNLVNSAPSCPGDGNRDGKVNQEDLKNYRYFSKLNGGRSSWYDFNHDGLTNEADLGIIISNLGRQCP